MGTTRGTGVTVQVTKIAWKRDNSVPAGQPAPGRFDCPCGTTISGVEFGAPETHTCTGCGRTWDGRGWLVGQPANFPGDRPHAPRMDGGDKCGMCGRYAEDGIHLAAGAR